jgi:hypothetical protein
MKLLGVLLLKSDVIQRNTRECDFNDKFDDTHRDLCDSLL